MNKINLHVCSSVLVSAFAMSLIPGCGAYDDGGGEDAQGAEAVEDIEFGLSATNEDCEAPDPNGPPISQTFPNIFPWTAHQSPSSYGSSQCSAAYVTKVTDATGRVAQGRTVFYDEVAPKTMPTSQAECTKYRLGVYAWNVNSSTPVLEFSKWQWGVWSNGRCSLAIEPTFGAGNNYRVAVSLRRHSTAGNSSSSYSLKSVRLSRKSFSVIG